MYTQHQMYILVRTDVFGIYLAAGNCRGHTEIKPETLEELEFTVCLSMYFGVLLEKLLPKSISCSAVCVCGGSSNSGDTLCGHTQDSFND